MPSEHAGAATAYLASKLAGEFHGLLVNGYDVLERAGLLKSVNVEQGKTKSAPAAAMKEDAISLIIQVEKILSETENDVNKLPVFVRPMARSGFKGKAGQSVFDWQRSLTALRFDLEAGRSPSQTNIPTLLEKLTIYFRDVPREPLDLLKMQISFTRLAS